MRFFVEFLIQSNDSLIAKKFKKKLNDLYSQETIYFLFYDILSSNLFLSFTVLLINYNVVEINLL